MSLQKQVSQRLQIHFQIRSNLTAIYKTEPLVTDGSAGYAESTDKQWKDSCKLLLIPPGCFVQANSANGLFPIKHTLIKKLSLYCLYLLILSQWGGTADGGLWSSSSANILLPGNFGAQPISSPSDSKRTRTASTARRTHKKAQHIPSKIIANGSTN